MDLHFSESRKKGSVISRKQNFFPPAPISSANVEPNPDAFNSFYHFINQFGSVFQLRSRIPAGGQSCSHEGASIALLRKDNFRQYGFVKLHEVAAFSLELYQFLPQYLHNVFRHF